MPDIIRPSLRNNAYTQLCTVQNALGMDNLLTDVMEGSLKRRLNKVHDAVARSGAMPVIDQNSQIDPGGFQIDLNQVRGHAPQPTPAGQSPAH